MAERGGREEDRRRSRAFVGLTGSSSVHLPSCSPSPRLLLLWDLFWVVSFPPPTDPATELAETLLEAAIEDERPQPPLVPCPSGLCVRVYYGWERAR